MTVSIPGTATVECSNPAQTRKDSGGPVPGQTTEVTATGTSAPLQADKNGNFILQAGQLVTDTPTVSSAACPNPKWSAEVTDVTFDFTQAVIFLEQPIGSTPVQIYP